MKIDLPIAALDGNRSFVVNEKAHDRQL